MVWNVTDGRQGEPVRATLAWRISSAYLVLILVLLLGIALYSASFVRSTYLDQLEQRLGAEASIAAGEAQQLLAGQTPVDLQPLAVRLGADGGARITLI